MQLKDGVRNILKICYRNGFFKLWIVKNSKITTQYGPLGSLLRRNIWREWFSSIINNVDVNMFPIEVGKSEKSVKLLSSNLSSFFLPDVFENYLKVVPSTGTDTPCGFAAYGTCLDHNQETINSEVLLSDSLFRRLECRYGMCVVFFCPFKKSSDWFNYWARYRYRWWRKLSSIPSKFSMSDVTETESKDQQISLMMEFPWGQENIETITMHKEHFFWDSCHTLSLKSVENVDSTVIVCESELTVAASAFITNSFAEKWRAGQKKKILQFNTKLAPYKICMCIRRDSLKDSKHLMDVAEHLEKELKKYRVAVYPYWKNSIIDEAAQFNRNDEMGVPYTIVLDSNALHSGIVHLRSRDTTLEEQVHIAELTTKLLKYLQIKSLGMDEF